LNERIRPKRDIRSGFGCDSRFEIINKFLQMRTRESNTSDAVSSRTAALVTANIIAVVIYLCAASSGWVEREVEDIPGASGGGTLTWFIFAVPVFLLSLVINFGCVVRSLIHRYRTGKWYFFWGAWIALPIWALAVAYDFSRHGI